MVEFTIVVLNPFAQFAGVWGVFREIICFVYTAILVIREGKNWSSFLHGGEAAAIQPHRRKEEGCGSKDLSEDGQN